MREVRGNRWTMWNGQTVVSDSGATQDRHALGCEMASEVVRSFGRLRLQVTGWSMFPSVLPGDVLIINRATVAELVEGDIVLYGRNSRLIAHRVIRQNVNGNPSVLACGDAMRTSDPVVLADEVLGKIFLIVRNGRHLKPKKSTSSLGRAVAFLFSRSEIAARVIVKIHGMRQSLIAPNLEFGPSLATNHN